MRILVSGSTGFLGSALVAHLARRGHEVGRLVRRRAPHDAGTVLWDPEAGSIDRAAIEGFAAVVHLAGESIGGGRWTRARKARIHDSRARGTRLLCQALADLARRPQVLVSASAIGYYGDAGDEVLREDHGPGSGFLCDVCRDWEAAADPACRSGIRVVHPRLGLVLAAHGGAFPRMLGPFRLGLGGRLGNGRQFMSWITLDDVVRVLERAVLDAAIEGPVNAVSPRPVRNAEFARTLGRVLGRPAILPAPAPALRLLLGEMAGPLLLWSARVQPAKLQDAGHDFLHSELEPALRAVLGKASRGGG